MQLLFGSSGKHLRVDHSFHHTPGYFLLLHHTVLTPADIGSPINEGFEVEIVAVEILTFQELQGIT